MANLPRKRKTLPNSEAGPGTPGNIQSPVTPMQAAMKAQKVPKPKAKLTAVKAPTKSKVARGGL